MNPLPRTLLTALAAGMLACSSGDSGTPVGPVLRTQNYTGSLDDPARCGCGNGIIQYTVDAFTAGTLQARATVQPADAGLVVRLLDSSFTNVLATARSSAGTATFTVPVAPATYRIQLTLAPETGPRQATYALAVTLP
jgi:hypothetical protein